MSLTSGAQPAVFLSYASQDAEAARRICEALRDAGVEVWFDQNELVGGDAWDAKIRKQITECALFVPVISANTQARLEGYFRLEWKLAAQRTHTMADEKTFLLPVVIDATRDAEAKVPGEFKAVQWTRLPGGEKTEAFCGRVKKLVGGGAVFPAAQETPERELKHRATPKVGRRVPAAAWIAATVAVLAFGGFVAFRPGSNAGAGTRPPTATAGPTAAAWPRDPELRRAMNLTLQLNSIREDLLLAEEIARRAVETAPADPEAVTVMAHVQAMFLLRNFDFTAERTATARRFCERAVQLAPDHPVALNAHALFLYGRGNDLLRAEEIARRVTQLEPDNLRAWGTLAMIVARQRPAEGIALAEENARRFRDDPLTRYNLFIYYRDASRYAEAERELDAAIALAPLGNALDWKARFALMHEDLPAMRQWIERVPARLRGEERAVLTSVTYAYLSGDTGFGLAALGKFPETWFYDISNYTGPKALLAAMLHGRRGNLELARAQYEAALTELRRYRDSHPNDPGTQAAEAMILIGLERRDEARAVNQAALQSQRRPVRLSAAHLWIGTAARRAFLVGDRGQLLALLREIATDAESRRTVRSRLKLDPSMAPFRDDAEIVALLAEPEAKGSAAAPAPESDAKSVAVLAFANLSDDKTNEYFSDGISEELLNVLAKVPGLKVSARTSAFFFKGRNVPIPEIAKQLGVAYVIEGSVRKAGSQVRIAARLIRAGDGVQVWSGDFREELKDVFALQDKIAGVVAENLQLTVGGASRPNRTVNPDAYALVLEGRYFWNQRAERPEEALGKAAAAFQRALALDANFAEAHAGLGDVWVTRGLYRSLDGRGASASADYAQAKVEVERALELNPALVEPHVTLGYVAYCERRFAASEQHYARAFAANPNYALAYHWHALLVSAFGRFDDSLREIEQSLRLDPLSSNTRWSATMGNYLLGRVAESLTASDRTLALRPGLVPGHGDRALILMQLGRKEEAAAEAREVGRDLELEPRWWADSDAIYVLRQIGLTAEADEQARRALAGFSKDDYRGALVFAALGRFAEALPAMEKIPTIALTRVYWHPMWDPFRDDPRFHQLLARLGCVEQYAAARETLARLRRQPGARP